MPAGKYLHLSDGTTMNREAKPEIIGEPRNLIEHPTVRK
jgi:hypothetical protein